LRAYLENQIDDRESALGSPLLWRFLGVEDSRIVLIGRKLIGLYDYASSADSAGF